MNQDVKSNPYEASRVKRKYFSIKTAGCASPFHFRPVGSRQVAGGRNYRNRCLSR